MNRIDRLFSMLTLLQSKKFVTADTIAEKFGISVRTVYRDVKAICESGIPVSFEQHKGYCIMPGFFLPPVAFTSEEAGALLLMENLVHGFADQSISRHYIAALNKIKSVMRNNEKDKLERLASQTRFQFPARMLNQTGFLSQLQEAISGETIVKIEYSRKDETSSTRNIEPIGLVFYAMSWHVIAWCHARLEYRDFKVSRIKALRKTGEPFTRSDHMALADYMRELPVDF